MKFKTTALSPEGMPIILKIEIGTPQITMNSLGHNTRINFYDAKNNLKIGALSISPRSSSLKIMGIENPTRNKNQLAKRYRGVGNAMLELILRLYKNKNIQCEPTGSFGFYYKSGFRFPKILTGEEPKTDIYQSFGLNFLKDTSFYEEFITQYKKAIDLGFPKSQHQEIISKLEKHNLFTFFKEIARFKTEKSKKEISEMNFQTIMDIVPEFVGKAEPESISTNEFCRQMIIFHKDGTEKEQDFSVPGSPGTAHMVLEGEELTKAYKKFEIDLEDDECLGAGTYLVENGKLNKAQASLQQNHEIKLSSEQASTFSLDHTSKANLDQPSTSDSVLISETILVPVVFSSSGAALTSANSANHVCSSAVPTSETTVFQISNHDASMPIGKPTGSRPGIRH